MNRAATADLLTGARRWLPLVQRPRPAAVSAVERVAELRATTDALGENPDPAAPAAVLNKAALLLSDAGHSDLAHHLCWQQFDVYQTAGPGNASGPTAALQPLVNIARLHTRAGEADRAYGILDDLHLAVLDGGTATIDGRHVDLAALIRPEDHQQAATFTWSVLLADGTRALAQAGRWTEAADRVRDHKGIGDRLFDGRQAQVLALATTGRTAEAIALLDASHVAEPWEEAVLLTLRGLCCALSGQPTGVTVERVQPVLAALDQDPALIVFRTRVAAMLLGLLDDAPSVGHAAGAVLDDLVVHADGYAAHDLLAAPWLFPRFSVGQRRVLDDDVAQAALVSHLSASLIDRLLSTARCAANFLSATSAGLSTKNPGM
ncbi:hypothetical protein L1785_13900 [Antribacter sp. KLBMP9083]|uniref:Uncharacterized protein n=1 Tax=Antribacter soli TaxID=2910976 RepID=A0AA41U9X9_9MICO|nr:hypothetical protein [Antribacter soli]MCF4122072.1 hypothetical protein [Antribacter soli]